MTFSICHVDICNAYKAIVIRHQKRKKKKKKICKCFFLLARETSVFLAAPSFFLEREREFTDFIHIGGFICLLLRKGLGDFSIWHEQVATAAKMVLLSFLVHGSCLLLVI